MTDRALVLVVACSLLPAAVARPQGLAIDHRPVGCVVAGKYPRLNACFAPTSRLARARVYFRVADGPAEWYYVEMKSDAPCFAGVLPRPKKQLVGRQLQYYVNALDRAFAEARTDENEARIVEKAADCDAKALVAPILSSASVAVFPGLPAGFAGAAGLGLGATAAIVGGGAALAGGTVAVAAGGGSASTGESGSGGGVSSGGTPGPPDTFPPTTTTTTTTTLGSWSPVFTVRKNGQLVDPTSPIAGTEPVVLEIDMCATVGPNPLRFAVEVDGIAVADTCHSKLTFTTAGVKSGSRGAVHASVTSRSYNLRLRIWSVGPNNDPKANRSTTVTVGDSTTTTTTTTTTPTTTTTTTSSTSTTTTSTLPAACSGDVTGPNVSLTSPQSGTSYPGRLPYPVQMSATADDSKNGNNGVAYVEYKVNYPGANQFVSGQQTTAPYTYSWTQAQVEAWLNAQQLCSGPAVIQAYAVDNCGNGAYSLSVAITVSNVTTCDVAPLARTGPRAMATWVSELAVPGGSGQVVVGGQAFFPRAGRSPIAVQPKPGENRVEATLVDGRSGGTWRFELGSVPGLRPDSIRVVAGDVVRAGSDALVFRLQGRPGERIVFSFVVGE